MDKLPCSTSLLMSINFDGLKDVINFFHKNMNIMNEKINDISKKFKGFEDIQNQFNDSKIKTEAGLRLLSDLEQSINNHSQIIIEHSNKISTNKDNFEELKLEIQKIKTDNKNISDKINNLESNLNNDIGKISEEENEINKMKIENKNNFDIIIKKVEDLDSKITEIIEKENKKSEIIKNEEENNINKKEEENKDEEKEENNMEKIENNILFKALTIRVNQLEEKIKKISEETIKNIITPNSNKVTEIKEAKYSSAENKFEDQLDNNFNDKLNEIENKISKLQNDFLSLNLNNNNNYDANQSPKVENQISDEMINNNKIQKDNNENINQKQEDINNSIEQIKNIISNDQQKFDSLEKKIGEMISQINELYNEISGNKFLGKNEFNKYSQKLNIQLKDYNDKINDILLKTSLNSESLKKLSSINKTSKNSIKTEYKLINNNKNDALLMETIESNTKQIIIEYLKKSDLANNPKILKIEKDLENCTNLTNELSNKLMQLSKIDMNNLKKEISELKEKTKKDIENNNKNIEEKIKNIPLFIDELYFCQRILFGKEGFEKYKKMSKEERRNEIELGTSIKDEMHIHSDYLKKLSEGINKVNNRLSNLNKENLAAIKKDLKNESNFILEDFKSGLKDSINKIETQLKDKVDKLGLDQFWNKINEQLIEEMKQKIDKKEMNKNNNYLKKKIDNLESKISRTLVDTLIDLQMDEAPLLVKKNFREITEQKCASCGQNLQNVNNNGILGFSMDFNNVGANQHKNFKPKNISDKDKLPEIKTNLQK